MPYDQETNQMATIYPLSSSVVVVAVVDSNFSGYFVLLTEKNIKIITAFLDRG